MGIDVARSAVKANVAMEIAMADIDVGLVRMQCEIGMPGRASLVCVLVAKRVHMPGAVTVDVGVNRISVAICVELI